MTSPEGDDEDRVCCICTDPVRRRARSLRACGHTFHAKCIAGWLTRNISCPLCRTPAVDGLGDRRVPVSTRVMRLLAATGMVGPQESPYTVVLALMRCPQTLDDLKLTPEQATAVVDAAMLAQELRHFKRFMRYAVDAARSAPLLPTHAPAHAPRPPER